MPVGGIYPPRVLLVPPLFVSDRQRDSQRLESAWRLGFNKQPTGVELAPPPAGARCSLIGRALHSTLTHTLSLSLNKSCRRRFWHCSCHRHANWLRRGLTTQQQTDGRTAPSSLFWRPAAVCFLHLLDWLEVAFSGRQMASLVSFEPNTWQVCAYSSTMSFTL